MGNATKLTVEQHEMIKEIAREHAKNTLLSFGCGKLSYEMLEDLLKRGVDLPEDVSIAADYELWESDVQLTQLREIASSYYWVAFESVKAIQSNGAGQQVASTEWWVAQRSAQAHINALYEMAKADGNAQLEEHYAKLRLSLITER